MSETSKAAAPAEGTADDRIKNLQQEFSRKLTNVESTLKASNDALLAQIQNLLPKQAPLARVPEGEDLETLMYTKPAEAVRRIKEDAKKELHAELDIREQATIKRNNVINKLFQEYPELGAQESDLYKLATSKYDEMAKEDGHTPAAYKAAVAEAAIELGVKPKSKRPADDESFSLSGGSSSRNRSTKKDEPEWTRDHDDLARLLGVSADKVKTRMKARKNFSKWE